MNGTKSGRLFSKITFIALLAILCLAGAFAALSAPGGIVCAEAASLTGGQPTKQDPPPSAETFSVSATWTTTTALDPNATYYGAGESYFCFGLPVDAGITDIAVDPEYSSHWSIDPEQGLPTIQQIRFYLNSFNPVGETKFNSALYTVGKTFTVSFKSTKYLEYIGFYNGAYGFLEDRITAPIKGDCKLTVNGIELGTYNIGVSASGGATAQNIDTVPLNKITADTVKLGAVPEKISVPVSDNSVSTDVAVYATNLFSEDVYNKNAKVSCELRHSDSDQAVEPSGVGLSFVSAVAGDVNSGQKIRISVDAGANANTGADLKFRLYVTVNYRGVDIGVYSPVITLEQVGFTAKFDAQSKGDNPPDQTVVYGQSPTFNKPANVARGYKFLGWSESADGAVLTAAPAMTGNKTFYAQYETLMFLTSYDSTSGYTIEGFSETYIASLADKTNISIVIPATYDDGSYGEKPVVAVGLNAFDMRTKGGTDQIYNGCVFTSLDLSGASNLERIGGSAFDGCSGLTGALTIPNSVTTIGSLAFDGCKGFNDKLTLPTNDAFKTIGEFAFYGCSGLTGALTIPDSVTTIGSSAFFKCSGFTGTLTLPTNDAFKTIGDFAFYGCNGLTGALTIPNSVTWIREFAFFKCSGFTGALTIPNSVTDIADNTFNRCSGLKTVYLPNNADGTTYGSYVFQGVDCPIVVPNADLYTQYKASGHNLRDNNLTYEISVTFNANGGTMIGAATQNKLFNLSCKYEKSADTGVWAINNAYTPPTAEQNYFAFAGWNAKSDGTGSAFNVVEASTYFAQYSEILNELLVSGRPGKTTYLAFDSFDPQGLSVSAAYLSGNRKTLSAGEFTVKYAGENTSFRYGETSVKICYTENDITKTASITGLNVEKIKLAKPTVDGTYVYTGALQTVRLASFNDERMTVSNNTRTNAGKQNVTVSLKDATNYGWSDNTTEAVQIEWEIRKVKLTPSVSGITSKAYDGGTAAVGAISLAGAVNNESPTATGTFSWTSANAGTTTVNVTDIALGASWTTNYELSATSLSNQSYGSAKINKVILTPSVSGITSKIYDGTADAVGTISLEGAVNNESPAATGNFEWTSANAGTTTVDVTDITLGEGWSVNYELSATSLRAQSHGNAGIGKVKLTPSVSGIDSKSYDGTADAVGAISLAGAVNNESPTATGTFSWTSANAGTTTVTVTGIALGESWTTNYELSATSLSNQSYGNAKINKVILTPSVSGIASKSYDGNTEASGTISLAGAVNNESPVAAGTFVWKGANAGTTSVDVTDITLVEGWTTNYELSATSLSNQSYGNAKIKKVILTPSVSAISSKNYDGSTSATGTVSLSGGVNNESPTASAAFTWTRANAGTTTVNVTNIALGESWTTNYELSATSLSNQSCGGAKIGKVKLTPSVSGIDSKSYDGTADAVGTISLAGAVNNESPTATGTFTWTSANAGTDTVSVSNIALGDGWTINYELTAISLSDQRYGNAKIDKVVLTPSVSGITSKIYDGNTDASGTISLEGAVNSESPTAAGTFEWTGASAGTNTFKVTNITLGEGWTTNYELSAVSLSNQAYGEAKIGAATISDGGAFTDYSGSYDKKAHAIGCDANKITVVNSQTVTVYYSTNGTGDWVTDPIIYTDFTNGAKTVYWKVSAPNHTDLTGSNTVSISKRAITVTAENKSSIHKADLAALTYTVTPTLYEGDAFGGALATNADQTVVGVYDITQGTLSAGDNYAVTFVAAKYTVIAKQTVSITLTAQEFTYDGEAKSFVINGTSLDGFTVEYYVGGVYGQDAPAGAGSYKIKVTREEDADNYAFGVEITDGLVILTQKVQKPAENTATFIYTGEEQIYALAEDSRYYVLNDARTDAGSQTVTVALQDTANYEWFGGGTDELAFIFEIEKASARITVDETAIVKTYGDVWTLPPASSNFGTVECDITAEQMRDAGRYTINYTVEATENYYGDGKSISVTVNKQKVAKPDADATIFVEDGGQKTYTLAEDARYAVKGNIRTETGSYTVTVALKDSANYEWSDGTTEELTFPFIIRKPQLTERIDENSEKEHVIVAAEDGFAPGVAVEVTVVARLETAREAVAESEKVSAIYDVKLLANGSPIQPDGMITIRFLIPDECVGVAFRLLHVHGGEATQMAYTIDGDYAVVTTDKLSEFVFITDNTGSVLWLIILLAVIFAAETVLAAIKLRKNAKAKSTKTYSFAPLLLSVFIPAGEISAAAILGALCVAGGVYNAYLYLNKKKKPREGALSDEAPSAFTAEIEETPEARDSVEDKPAFHVPVRYRKSFKAKLIQSPDEIKGYYGELKNAILAYKKTASRIFWNYDRINCGRSKLAKFGIRGKTLCLYLALDPSAVEKKYGARDASDNKKYAQTPCCVRVKSVSGLKKALALIDRMMTENNAVKNPEFVPTEYAALFPYEETDALIARGLIKATISAGSENAPKADLSKLIRDKITVAEARSVLSDLAAATLIDAAEIPGASGNNTTGRKAIVNIDALAKSFAPNDVVTPEALKEKGLIPGNTAFVKVLARGSLDKPLTVNAHDFSLDAVRMIALTGGKAIKIS